MGGTKQRDLVFANIAESLVDNFVESLQTLVIEHPHVKHRVQVNSKFILDRLIRLECASPEVTKRLQDYINPTAPGLNQPSSRPNSTLPANSSDKSSAEHDTKTSSSTKKPSPPPFNAQVITSSMASSLNSMTSSLANLQSTIITAAERAPSALNKLTTNTNTDKKIPP